MLPRRRFSQIKVLRHRTFEPPMPIEIDLVALYESKTGHTLKKSGRTYFGVCPFHNEDTPSFAIYPDTQSVFCFGCQFSANAAWFSKKLNEL